MTAIVLPDVDRSTIDDLKKRLPNIREIDLPNLKELELPKMQQVGRSADEAVDRLLGRSRAPVWPWVAAGIGLVAVIGAVGAWFALFRRPTWESTSITTTPTSSALDTPLAGDLTPDPIVDSPASTSSTASPFATPYEEA
jgi:hypothetical protein